LQWATSALPEIHDGKAGDEVEARHELLYEVEKSAECALPASEHPEENEGGDRSPDDITELTQAGDGITDVSQEIH